jgi:transposase
VDEETGIPMWYEHYDGSLLDKVQTSFSLKKIVDAGYQKLFAMFDRGYFSEDVIKALRNVKDLEYGCPLPRQCQLGR